ncbi:MAG: hypothetical protein WDW36_004995 [Sanguina aurantia]
MLLTSSVTAQFGDGKKEAPPKAPYRKADLKYIGCQVCEAIVKQSLASVRTARQEATPGKKLQEGDVLTTLETMCDPDTDAGDWITRYDIVEDRQNEALRLRDTGRMGKCGSECRTIAKSCEAVTDAMDLTDLSAFLVVGKRQRTAINQWACYESSQACSKKPSPVPQKRKAGEAHIPLSDDEVRNQKMLRSMKAAGMSGTMYDRESLMNGDLGDMGTDEDGNPIPFPNEEYEEERGGSRGSPPVGDREGHPLPEDSLSQQGGLGGLTGDLKAAAGALQAGVGKVADSVAGFASGLAGRVADIFPGKKKDGVEL